MHVWVVQFIRHNWRGLLSHLESLAWPEPSSVQVLVRDEDDDCFGLWMIYDGKLVEVPLPRTEREPFSASVTGVLFLDRPSRRGAPLGRMRGPAVRCGRLFLP
ncbi:hypothetical protein SMICM17S_05953 [Streptomyces microflavus]